jgi:hypothetical protein
LLYEFFFTKTKGVKKKRMSFQRICDRIFWNFDTIAIISDNHQNLRVENSRLYFDDRWFLSFRRLVSYDNRHKVLDCIEETIAEWCELVKHDPIEIKYYNQIKDSVMSGLEKLAKLGRYAYDMTFQMRVRGLLQRLAQLET